MSQVSSATWIAGVVGQPVGHSLSPLIHNTWIRALDLDAIYLAFAIEVDRFPSFIESLRGGSVRGLNVTLPFKAQALALSDHADHAAQAAGASNLLIFLPDGRIRAHNTDGLGLIGAFASQAPELQLTGAKVALIGAGGAARGAVAALAAAGTAEVRVIARNPAKARDLAERFPGQAVAFALTQAAEAFADVAAIINATSAGLAGEHLELPLQLAPAGAVVMDMTYKPLHTPLLAMARAAGRPVVDGLAMLVEQAAPAFLALYGQPAPLDVDVRSMALAALRGIP